MLAVGWMYTLPTETGQSMNKVTFPLWEAKQTHKWTSGCMTPTTYFGTCFFVWGQSLWVACVILVEVQSTGVNGRSERRWGEKRRELCWIWSGVSCIRTHQPVLLLSTCSTVHSRLHKPSLCLIQGLHPSQCAFQGQLHHHKGLSKLTVSPRTLQTCTTLAGLKCALQSALCTL